jgi:hypothetical protein
LALTHDDLDSFAQALDGSPAAGYLFLNAVQREALTRLANNPKLFGPRTVAATDLQGDAVSLLTRFLRRPDDAAWCTPVAGLALALTGGSMRDSMRLAENDVPVALGSVLRTGELPAATSGRAVVHRRTEGGASVLVDIEQRSAVRVYLGVDDRQETIARPEHEHAWRDWLALSNLLQFLGPGRFSAGTTSSPVPGSEAAVSVDSIPRQIDAQWVPMLGAFGPLVDAVVHDLARHGAPIPEPGHEARDGAYVIDLAWVDKRIGVVTDEDVERDLTLSLAGWRLFTPSDITGLLDALATEGDSD